MIHLPYPPVITEKVWGKEIEIANDEYCGKMLILDKDKRCSIHWHIVKTETFYFLNGKCLFEWTLNNPTKTYQFIIPNGTALKIMPNTLHRFNGIAETTRIIEISTHDDPEDSYRNTHSEHIEGGSVKWAKYPLYRLS